MAWVLLAPVVDEHLLRPGRHVARPRSQHREPAAHDASVARRARRRRARVARGARTSPDRRGAPDRRVIRVEHVHLGRGREVRMDGEPEKAAIPHVVDVRPQVGEDRRGRIGQRIEDLDDAALLGDEDVAVRGEHQRGWVREGPARKRGVHDLVDKRRVDRGGGDGRSGPHGQHHRPDHQWQDWADPALQIRQRLGHPATGGLGLATGSAHPRQPVGGRASTPPLAGEATPASESRSTAPDLSAPTRPIAGRREPRGGRRTASTAPTSARRRRHERRRVPAGRCAGRRR